MRAFGAWQVGSSDAAAAEAIWRSGCCKRLTAALLAARGIRTPEEAREFLREDNELLHDPYSMADMDKAVARLRRAVADQEIVAVYGDYDVDGLTASALMTSWLRLRGLTVYTHIPERLTEGYGICDEVLDELAQEQVTLLVTVDCGVTALEQVRHANALGMEVVVTDHHECMAELPEAIAVVDPHRKDDAYPFKGLAGVGVAFKLLCALEGDERLPALLEYYGPLVALGTIADIMPVIDENRVLIRQGIQMLQTGYSFGVGGLMEEIRVDKRRLSGTDISFSLVPKLNAAGRMGHVRVAFDLLMERNEAGARRLARELCEMNAERRTVEDRVYQEAIGMVEAGRKPDGPIVLASENWHQGVSGIVASRLAERFGVPAVIISLEGDEGRGSCRSYGGFSIYGALEAVQEELLSFGGHELAAGLTLPRDGIDRFRRKLQEYYHAHEGDRSQLNVLVDFPVEDLTLLTLDEVDALQRMSPWGMGNAPPTLCIRDATAETLTPIGGDKHLKLIAQKNGRRFECVFFGVSVKELGVKPGMKVDLAFEPGVNDFRGNRSVQLLLRDVRPSRVADDQSLQAARRFFDGERMSPMENAMLAPDRTAMGRVWRYLTQRSRRFEEAPESLLPDIALRTGIPVLGRIWVALRVLDELGLIRLTEAAGSMDIYIPRTAGKTDLSRSALLGKLR